jgi:TRAP-type mannitol/chloroaromatic compound transport system permease small subunit
MFIIFVFNICIYMVFQDIDKKKLKMVCKKLSALTTGVQTYIVKVKVTRLWESVNNKTYELRYDFD